MLKDELDVIGIKPVIDRHENATGCRHTVVRLQQRRDVRSDEGDAVAPLQAGGAQGRGQPAHPLAHLAVRVAPVLMDDSDLVGVHELAALQEAQWVELTTMGKTRRPPPPRC